MDQMPEVIKEFSHVEYLTVFNAILFGYVGAEYFSGWASMLRNRNSLKHYWQHILWTIFAFTLYIQNWYGVWPRVIVINENVYYFLFSLAPILVFHFISVILFPDFSKGESFDIKKYYFENLKWLYGLFAAYFLLTIINSFVYPDIGNVLAQNLIRAGGIALCLLAIIFKKQKYIHPIFLVIGYVALILFLRALPS
jgi:hypothetical protein